MKYTEIRIIRSVNVVLFEYIAKVPDEVHGPNVIMTPKEKCFTLTSNGSIIGYMNYWSKNGIWETRTL